MSPNVFYFIKSYLVMKLKNFITKTIFTKNSAIYSDEKVHRRNHF